MTKPWRVSLVCRQRRSCRSFDSQRSTPFSPPQAFHTRITTRQSQTNVLTRTWTQKWWIFCPVKWRPWPRASNVRTTCALVRSCFCSTRARHSHADILTRRSFHRTNEQVSKGRLKLCTYIDAIDWTGAANERVLICFALRVVNSDFKVGVRGIG